MSLVDLRNEKKWYLVGLIASDGSLSVDKRHIDITSSDSEYLQRVRCMCDIRSSVAQKIGGKGTKAFRIQIADKLFYDFLKDVGLNPKKSRVIGPLRVPKEYFCDFLRGEIDGDGSIRSWVHPSNGCEQWSLRIVSASKKYLEWISDQVQILFRARGRIYKDQGEGFSKYVLKYGKISAQVILRYCYWCNDLVLPRKHKLALSLINTKSVWKRSKTVMF